MRRTVGMCVMYSDSGLGSTGVAGTLRWCSDEDRSKLEDAPVAVTVVPVAVPVVKVVVDESKDEPSSGSGASITLERLFIAKDRGRVRRSWSLLDRKEVDCVEVRVRGALERKGNSSFESAGIAESSEGPWPW